jgi:ubiquinone/menaquinone biosynthesis C-methylase UbiE
MNFGTDNEARRISWVTGILSKIPPGKKILDAGAGEMPFRQYCSHLRYTSQDLSWSGTAKKKEGLQPASWEVSGVDIKSDIASIPLKSRSVDAVLCTEVLEHLPDPLAALREFSRLLKKGGWLILTAPFCSLTHFAPQFYCTGFSPYYYKKHLPSLGFKIKEVTPNGNYYEYLAQEAIRLEKVVKELSGQTFTYFDGLVGWLFIRILEKFSRRDPKQLTTPTLCFDYNVLAVKK